MAWTKFFKEGNPPDYLDAETYNHRFGPKNAIEQFSRILKSFVVVDSKKYGLDDRWRTLPFSYDRSQIYVLVAAAWAAHGKLSDLDVADALYVSARAMSRLPSQEPKTEVTVAWLRDFLNGLYLDVTKHEAYRVATGEPSFRTSPVMFSPLPPFPR